MITSSNQEVELFAEAMRLSGEERSSFLDCACAGDPALRQKLEELLKSNDRVGNFLDEPPTSSIADSRSQFSSGEKPGDWVGRYRLLEQIGEGGCGVVFRAQQTQAVFREVALKVVKPGMDTKNVIARFAAERQALALMDHPNIAKIFDTGETASGRPYFVMELVRGQKVTEYCDRHSLSTEARLKLFIQVCQAVQHAHQKGIIHRDIKPSNILVSTTEQGAALPIVIDFGIAKAMAGQLLCEKTILTGMEMIIGTPAYMSPEQATFTSADIDTRSDIYSLGVLLYELLTGSTPFDSRELLRGGIDQIRRVIQEQEPVRPSSYLSKLKNEDLTDVARRRQSEPPTLIRALRGDLDWIVMKALEKDRARRYETATGFALDIKRYLANEAISARPPSKVYRMRKMVARNKLVFASIAVIATFLVASLVVVSVALARERKAALKSQHLIEFFNGMLGGVGRSVARGRDKLMLQEILDQTADRIGKHMSNEPDVEAELRMLMGGLYGELGQAEKAAAMARHALAIRREVFGNDSLETAASLDLLGHQLMAQRKSMEAEPVHAEALAIRKRRLGLRHPDTAISLNAVAEVYRDQRKLEQAETLALEGLHIRQIMRSNSLDVADSLRNLAMIQGYQGKWAEAELTARKVLRIRLDHLGREDRAVASAMEDIAWILNGMQRFAEAHSLNAEAFKIQQRLLGDAHPDVLRTGHALGQLLGNRGDLESAEGVLKSVLQMQRKMLGDKSAATLQTFSSLAKALHKAGKLTEAEVLWREALAIWPHIADSADPERLYALRGLGDSLESQGKWAQAVDVWRESLVLWRKRGGIEEQQSMYTLRKLGLALEAARNWPEAQAAFNEALSISRKKGNYDPEVIVDMDRVVRVFTARQKFSEAEQLLESILTPEFTAKPESVNLLVQRVNVFGRQGRWQEAAKYARLALENQLTDHYRYHTLAGLLARTGDRQAYEVVCKRMVEKFADSTDPYVAERIVQDLLLLPHSGADLVLLDKLADKAVTTGIGTDGFPYFQACKAMSCYRSGNFADAIAWGDKATKSVADFARAKAYAVLSMALWQSGNHDQARDALAKGEALAPNISPGNGVVDLGESWVAWLMARISLDEATQLLQTIDYQP